MTEKKAAKKHGLSLRLVIITMFIVCAAVSGVLLAVTYRLTDRYADTANATQDYLTCQENVYLIRDAIHDFNERARNFVVSGNQEEVIRYFNEEQVQRSIDTARNSFNGFQLNETILKHLDTAIQLNGQMAVIQHYAMRLAVEGYGYNVEKYPQALGEVSLTAEDLALSPAEKLARALEMLFARNYTLLKNQVDARISLCMNMLADFMNNRHQSSSGYLENLLTNQRALIVGMILTLLLVMIFVLSLVVYPIHNLIRGISGKRQVTAQGAKELRFLAETYNQIHEQMEDAYSQISYEAAHDGLTGLYNRSAYDAIRQQIGSANIALLLVDIDLFKEVNDQNGHDVGDKVLIRVAKVLVESFREADRVCRIGGDEFAVIMVGATSAITHVIRKKIAQAMEILSVPDGDVPGVTISVGCAFSNLMEEGESLFKSADRALYRVKQSGRGNYGFYHLNPGDETHEQTAENKPEA